MNDKNFIVVFFAIIMLIVAGCDSSERKSKDVGNASAGEVNIYTHRHYDADKSIYEAFEKETGIKVNIVSASADELLKKLEIEGERTPADILITVDAGRLYRAKESGLLQAFSTPKLEENIPAKFRDKDGFWYGLTYRARVIVYAKDRINPEELSTYEDLISDKWRSKVLVRASDNIYNQSLLASIIAADGKEDAKNWASGIVKNMARSPKGSDRDQVKAIASNIGDLAIVNTYYVGLLLNSSSEEDVKAAESVGVFFPNQNDRGTHINVSGASITKYSPNKENAIKLMEFLSDSYAQEVYANANFEYPVKPGVQASEILKSWGTFKSDDVDFQLLGEYNRDAVVIFDQAGWK